MFTADLTTRPHSGAAAGLRERVLPHAHHGRHVRAPETPPRAAGVIWTMIERLRELDGETWTQQIDSARDLFSHAAAEVGVTYFTYQLIRSPHLSPADSGSCIISTLPEDMHRVYPGPKYSVEDDPIAAVALRSVRPFAWQQLHEASAQAKDWTSALDRFRGAGFRGTLTIPIHFGGECAMLSVVPSQQNCFDVPRQTHTLCLLAHFLHQHVRRAIVEVALSVSPRRHSLLSPRETEVLAFAASGKSTCEIAAALGISAKGVEFHIEGAKRKLRASNRTHAVAKALTLGLLPAES